jgi:uncharacterized membrane protein
MAAAAIGEGRPARRLMPYRLRAAASGLRRHLRGATVDVRRASPVAATRVPGVPYLIDKMFYCLECREEAVGPVCHRCGANSIQGAGPGQAASAGLGTARASALCYAGWVLTAVVFLALPGYRRDRTVRFHAYQCILLAAALVVAFFTMALWVPLAWRESALWLLQVAALTLWMSLILLCWMGKSPSLPVIGPLAERQL